MKNRYIKNENMLTREQNLSLRNKRVLVVGCGGLGGHIVDQLARLGIGHITAVDGDVFDETNLNRQLLSNVDNVGKSKALAAKEHVVRVNPDIYLEPLSVYVHEANAEEITKGYDVICDALDNVSSRFILQKFAERNGVPMVYGAIAGWYGQVATIFPGDKLLERLYRRDQDKGVEQNVGNPSFTPALVASIQVAEVLKILTGKGTLLRNRLLVVNTFEQEFEVLDFI
ncbi:HesA/MoeB/ThiF family protein [Perlabentimonas gracilis]|uniref:HesA/MoeB/ThiF family protein n=1 Tax=Perlabentimonas gracilis TaxID=2715279 RepID=UPI00140BB8F1|nr:HesA/MoeB/ThiF family protein [Perlabentimonas gracilis]NHB67469.1 HesA/MoeB/ThiF family protein [Perlabentimonas gracilis]